MNVINFIQRLHNYIRRKGALLVNAVRFFDKNELELILSANKDKLIVIFPPLFDWELELTQRPQHVAENLSNNNILYFYCTPNMREFKFGFREIKKNLYVTSRFDLLQLISKRKIFHIYAQDPSIHSSFIKSIKLSGDLIYYEIVDEITEELNCRYDRVKERHELVISDDSNIISATASKLLEPVEFKRTSNTFISTNGVDYDHFSVLSKSPIPYDYVKVVSANKPIIGYFGAIASWLDVELLLDLARKRPRYQIVLIGKVFKVSKAWEELLDLENVFFLGIKPYRDLPTYAQRFDVCIIPFKVNEITLSTSPVKLFEYMALSKPIVTTDLPECRKYQSALIAKNNEEFSVRIDEALKLRLDPEYLKILSREGLQNTWGEKARIIAGSLWSSYVK